MTHVCTNISKLSCNEIHHKINRSYWYWNHCKQRVLGKLNVVNFNCLKLHDIDAYDHDTWNNNQLIETHYLFASDANIGEARRSPTMKADDKTPSSKLFKLKSPLYTRIQTSAQVGEQKFIGKNTHREHSKSVTNKQNHEKHNLFQIKLMIVFCKFPNSVNWTAAVDTGQTLIQKQVSLSSQFSGSP